MILKETTLRMIIREFMGLGVAGKKKKGGGASGGGGGGGGGGGDWMGYDYEDRYTPQTVDVKDQPGLDDDSDGGNEGDGDGDGDGDND
jgi:hypothetical protein